MEHGIERRALGLAYSDPKPGRAAEVDRLARTRNREGRRRRRRNPQECARSRPGRSAFCDLIAAHVDTPSLIVNAPADAQAPPQGTVGTPSKPTARMRPARRRALAGPHPLVAWDGHGRAMRLMLCRLIGHRLMTADSTGRARCARCLSAVDRP